MENTTERIIFSIEKFVINDRPGIRMTVFLKGYPLHCAWCHNLGGISKDPQYMTKKNEYKLCGYTILQMSWLQDY